MSNHDHQHGQGRHAANSGQHQHVTQPVATSTSTVAISTSTAVPTGTLFVPDPIFESGHADTVTLPVTGHVLSLPHPERGEMFPGYCERVSAQANGDRNLLGMLFNGGASALFEKFGGFKEDGSNWPLAADTFFNGSAYMTQAQRDAAAAADQQFEHLYDAR